MAENQNVSGEEQLGAPIKIKKVATLKRGGKLVVWLGLAIVLIVGIFFAWKFYFKAEPVSVSTAVGQDQSAAVAQADPKAQAAAAKEVKLLVAAVGKFIILPSEETPTVATVMDAKALIAEQTFYSGAVNGDKLLVYSKAQKAVLFSPSRNVLVNVGPVYFNNNEQPANQGAGSKTTASSSNK